MSATDCLTLQRSFGRRGFAVHVRTTATEILDLVRSAAVTSLIIADTLSLEACVGLCRSVRQLSPGLPVLVLSRNNDPARRLELFEAGVDHCVPLPARSDKILVLISLISHLACGVPRTFGPQERLPGAGLPTEEG